MTLYFCHVHSYELVEDDNVNVFINAADPDAAQRLWYLWMHNVFDDDDDDDVDPEDREPPGSWYGVVVAEGATLYITEVPSPAATGIVNWKEMPVYTRTITRVVSSKPHPCTDHLFVFNT